jgi:hypothetical protein
MEEARLDHGLDRLPFFLLFLLLLTFPAFATTFGPMTISNQVDNARYFVRGRVVGGSWVQEDQASKRPFTYWKISITSQPKGASLGSDVVIRQPGGEIGAMGYHVAGSATFREGEEVFVALRDTAEPAKEVTGLASGKYTVERGADGEPVVRSGLGFTVKDTSGRAFNPEAFTAFVRKIASGQATDEERNVFLNKDMTHDHSPEVDRGVEDAKRLMKESASAGAPGAPASGEKTSADIKESSVQENVASTEEPSGSSSSGWVVGGVIALFLILGFWLFRRR